ncbi:MAG: hypothetical protein R2688_08980 [Fimbriimonadaceae bacterium]
MSFAVCKIVQDDRIEYKDTKTFLASCVAKAMAELSLIRRSLRSQHNARSYIGYYYDILMKSSVD